MADQNNQPSFTSYQPRAEELSNTQLRAATWYVRHRHTLATIGVVALGLFGAVTLLYSSWQWGYYFFVGYVEDQRMDRENVLLFQNYQRIQPLYGAQPLQYGAPQILNNGNNVFDLVAEVRNRNERWIAEVTYHYAIGQVRTPTETLVLPPGQTNLLPALGVRPDRAIASAQLVIESLRWRHLSPHVLDDVATYVTDRTSFTLTDVQQTRGSVSAAPTDRITFSVTNDTAFTFFSASFLVVLYDRGVVSAVRPLSIDTFAAGETRTVDLRFVTGFGQSSELIILPTTNIFDRESYIVPR